MILSTCIDYKAIPVISWKDCRKNIAKYKILMKEIEELDCEYKGNCICMDCRIRESLYKTACVIRNRAVEGNLRLVLTMVEKYLHKGQSAEELVAEGHHALTEAVDLFDLSRGFRFSTYAACVIKTRVYNKIGTTNLVLTRGILSHVYYVESAYDRLYIRENMQHPTLDQVLIELNESGPKSMRGKWKKKRIEYLLRAANRKEIKSLNAKFHRGDRQSRYGGDELDVVSDKEVDTDLKIDAKELIEYMDKCLPLWWKRVFYYYAGINCDDTHNLKETGKKFGICRERVRQIRDDVIRMIKKNLYHLEDYKIVPKYERSQSDREGSRLKSVA